MELTANNTVVELATALDGDSASNHQMLPDEEASQIPAWVIVPHDAVDSGNVIAVLFVKAAFDAVLQFVLLFVKLTLA